METTNKNSGQIYVKQDLHEDKQHGSLNYPVAFYHIDLRNMYLGIVRWHWHEEMEFMYVTRGSAKFLIQDKCYVLKKGECVMVNRNTMHAVQPVGGCECEYETIVFHPNFVFGYEHSYLSSHYMLPLLQNPGMRGLFLSPEKETDKQLLAILVKIIEVNKEKPYAYELKTKGMLVHIWLLLLERMATDHTTDNMVVHNPQSSIDEKRVKLAINYIAKHYAQPITLDDIAGSIHISKSECCRCFKRCVQVTPFEYLLKYRIYTAIDLLQNNEEEYSISEIAMRTGFNSSSYFNKIFKKYMECTPSAYKKQMAMGITAPIIPTHIDMM